MRTRDFRLVRYRLSDRVEIIDGAEVICRISANRLTHNQKVRSLRRMAKDWRSDKVVVDDLSHLASIDVTQHVWLGVAGVEDGRLANVQLSLSVQLQAVGRSPPLVPSRPCHGFFGNS